TQFVTFTPSEPAFLLLDYDGKGQPRAVSEALKRVGGFWKAIVSVAPALAGAARVSRTSTSAGLIHQRTRGKLKKSSGRHVYVLVKDGGDIERALKTLHDRLWLGGWGYFIAGAIGQRLDRSIIDAAVYGPERLVFEGAPVLVPPVAQDAAAREPRAYDGVAIDTAVAIPLLTEQEQAQVARLKVAAWDCLKSKANE